MTKCSRSEYAAAAAAAAAAATAAAAAATAAAAAAAAAVRCTHTHFRDERNAVQLWNFIQETIWTAATTKTDSGMAGK